METQCVWELRGSELMETTLINDQCDQYVPKFYLTHFTALYFQ